MSFRIDIPGGCEECGVSQSNPDRIIQRCYSDQEFAAEIVELWNAEGFRVRAGTFTRHVDWAKLKKEL